MEEGMTLDSNRIKTTRSDLLIEFIGVILVSSCLLTAKVYALSNI
jgi:hypothetical protein